MWCHRVRAETTRWQCSSVVADGRGGLCSPCSLRPLTKTPSIYASVIRLFRYAAPREPSRRFALERLPAAHIRLRAPDNRSRSSAVSLAVSTNARSRAAFFRYQTGLREFVVPWPGAARYLWIFARLTISASRCDALMPRVDVAHGLSSHTDRKPYADHVVARRESPLFGWSTSRRRGPIATDIKEWLPQSSRLPMQPNASGRGASNWPDRPQPRCAAGDTAVSHRRTIRRSLG